MSALIASAVLWAKICTADACTTMKIADFYQGKGGQLLCKANAQVMNGDPQSVYYCKNPSDEG